MAATPRNSHQSSIAHTTIELSTLLRQYDLELVLITGGDPSNKNAADRGSAGTTGARSQTAHEPTTAVQWVHGSDMADPTPFLTPRTVLLTTGGQFGKTPTAALAEAYVARLKQAGVTALGFGVGLRWQRIPQSLIAACEQLSLPLFRVPYQTPFLAIVQTAARLLNAHTHARDAWALESQRSVANAAVQHDGLGAVVREAASRLGRWVAITDRTGRLIEFAPSSLRGEVSSEWIRRETRELVERGGRASRVRPLSEVSVELQTLGRSNRLLGVLLTPTGVGDHAERTLLGLIAAIATLQFEHSAGRHKSDSALRTTVLKLMLAGEIELAERVAEGVLPRLPHGRVNVVRLNPTDTLAENLIEDLRSLAGAAGALSASIEAGTVLVCEGPQLASVRRVLQGHGVAAGISERGSIESLGQLLEQAEIALRHSQAAQMNDPVDYQAEMHGGVLRLLDAQPEARRLAEGLLAPVRQHDERHGDQLERSLAIWLGHHGQTSPAAAELGVHRHTLSSRMQTAASLLHRDLDDADTRAELWAALRLSPGSRSRPELDGN